MEIIGRSKKDFKIGEIIQFVKPFNMETIKTGTLAVVRNERKDGDGCGCCIPYESTTRVFMNVPSKYIERFIN